MTPPFRRPVVVVTRADAPEGPFAERLASAGIDVEWLPAISVLPPEDPGLLDEAIARVAGFDWIVFTSVHAVDAVVGRPGWRAAWPGAGASKPRLAAIGPATAGRLAERGHAPALEAADAGGEGLASALLAASGGSLEGVSVLWPCSSIARRTFADEVSSRGAALSEVVAYRTMPARADLAAGVFRRVRAHEIEAVAFFSPSAASSLAAAAGGGTLAELAGETLVASIGPATSAALRSLGAPPDLEAQPHTAEAMAAGLAQRLS
jgi:uroporphyrinogen-III synthase